MQVLVIVFDFGMDQFQELELPLVQFLDNARFDPNALLNGVTPACRR